MVASLQIVEESRDLAGNVNLLNHLLIILKLRRSILGSQWDTNSHHVHSQEFVSWAGTYKLIWLAIDFFSIIFTFWYRCWAFLDANSLLENVNWSWWGPCTELFIMD